MMQSLRIFFRRKVQKRKLDIRRYDFHHQFHSFLHFDDHLCSHSRSVVGRFSLIQQRYRTTYSNSDRISRKFPADKQFLRIDDTLRRLNEDVLKEEFRSFDNGLYEFSENIRKTKTALSLTQTKHLVSTLWEWNKKDHAEREYVRTLKFLANLNFSVFDPEHQAIVFAILDQCLQKKQESFRWFAMMLSGMRRLNYSGTLLQKSHKERILESLGKLKYERDESSFLELLSGITGLGIRWNEISDSGKQMLLRDLETNTTELSPRSIYEILFNFGKLGVNLKETNYNKAIIELVGKALNEIEESNGTELPREVSLIKKHDLLERQC
jgi:hypothetical protein